VIEAGPQLLQRLEKRLIDEPSNIQKLKAQGKKVIGYFCPYIPEELILASGMLPLRLAFGGQQEIASRGEEFLKPYSCPFARACLGYPSAEHPYFDLVDAFCVAQTCENMKQVQEYLAHFTGKPVFSVGLPHTHDSHRSRPQALKYFTEELRHLGARLGEYSGKPVRNRDVRKAIDLCNSIRERLSCLFNYSISEAPPVTWSQSFSAAQAGFLIDRRDFLAELENIARQVRNNGHQPPPENSGVRLMVVGSIVAIGDKKVLDVIKTAGGKVVADNTCTGSSTCRKNVTVFGFIGDPISALAERYLYNVPCPCMTDLTKRIGRMEKVAADFKVKGAIYYTLKYCDTWRSEYQLIKDHLNKTLKIPILLIESDYSPSDVGTLRTKVEAFIEMVEGLN
jgi:benzoyl-CoA reductase/2-hydroxyglutaryl-CoA dehydratase subunit BcrC/BadD/HgdB